MRIRYDKSIDVAYIYFTDKVIRSRAAKTYACDPSEVGGQIHIDFDNGGLILGIEVLEASHLLPPEALG
jgi:uncharacterized protein YuzE